MGGVDRRPWLILSRAECEALRDAAMAGTVDVPLIQLPPALLRALRVIDEQIAFIDHGFGEEPTVRLALQREPVR